MKKISVISIVSNLIFIIFIISIILFICNYKIYIVASGSMQPTLQQNELIIIKKYRDNTSYKIGDIITYYNYDLDDNITHRVVSITENGYYTKGDFNNAEDVEEVNNEQIIGKLVYSSRFLGNLYVKYRFILVSLGIGIIIILTILSILINNKKEKRRGNYNEEET